jgi:aspartate 1-decarboxylase
LGGAQRAQAPGFADEIPACGGPGRLVDFKGFQVYPVVGTLRQQGRSNSMQVRMFWSKIHRAVITHADLHYEGSCTIDADLMDAADIMTHQELHIWNVTRGTRLVTYALPGPRGSGVICINGAAAHGNVPGDLVILATFAEMSREEARLHEPKVVRVDRDNKLLGIREETPGPQMPPQIDELN